jgi:uncharacterized membrane protein (GlpM family)
MNPSLYLVLKALLSGGLIVAISELAKRNNLVASIVHSLPLVSLTAFIWLYFETGDTALIGRHSRGTFWFVLPTLPLFLLLPALFHRGWSFWPALSAGVALTIPLFALTMQLLKAARVQL